jgi:hypothetical protein
MRLEEIYPDDHLEKIPNDDLRRALGLSLGSLHRFRTAASEFWKWKQHHASSADPNPLLSNAAASSSSAGKKRKAQEDDSVVVMYKRTYKDGEKRMAFRHYKDGRDPTYDDGLPVFNVPISQDSAEMWGQYVEEQEKLHKEEGVMDYVMVADGGYWMRIPPTQDGFFNPLTDNASLYTCDDPFSL